MKAKSPQSECHRKQFYTLFRKMIAVIAICFFVPNEHIAQQFLDIINNSSHNNYYEIRNSIYQSIENQNIEDIKGWKQFKRWEYFWKSRVNSDGSFPDGNILWEEIQKYRNSNVKPQNKAQSSKWECIGPRTSKGGYNGLGRINCVAVHPENPNIIWAGTASGGLWYTSDAGVNWSTNTDNLPSIGISDIVIVPKYPFKTMYLATGDRDAGDTYSIGILKSSDGGVTWEQTGFNRSTNQYLKIGRLLLNPNDFNILIAATNHGIFRTEDNGESWSLVQEGNFKDMELKPNDPDVIYASGNSFFKSDNGGKSWYPVDAGLPKENVRRIAIGVTPDNPEIVYTVHAKASTNGLLGIYKSTDVGETFTCVKNDIEPNLLGWYGNGSDKGGQASYDLCIAVAPFDANMIFVGGINIWKSTNSGKHWNPCAMWTSHSYYNPWKCPVVHADHHELFFVPNSTKLFSANDGGLDVSSDYGITWEYISSGIINTQFYRIGISEEDENLIIAGSQDNGTKLFSDSTWTDVLGGDGMECIIDHSNPNNIYFSLYFGDLKKSTNRGKSYSNKVQGLTEDGSWITPFAMDPKNPEILWGGFRNIFKTTNGGDKWTRVSDFGSSDKFEIIEISSVNPNIVIAGYSKNNKNTLKITSNSGISWGNINVPDGNLKDICCDDKDSNKIFICYGGFNNENKVYFSEDKGKNWNNISGNLPQVPINCILKESGSSIKRLWVGTDIGIWYSDNYTGNWQTFNDGLPCVVITELEINYTSGKLLASTYGRGVWETNIPGEIVKPVLLKPFDKSNAQPTNELTFKWVPIPDVNSYRMQIGQDLGLADIVLDTIISSDSLLYSTSLDNNRNYYWRVKANSVGLKSWSDTWMFLTEMQYPILLFPEDSTSTNEYGFLRWSKLSSSEYYIVEISENKFFKGNRKISANVNDEFYYFDSLKLNHYYYWRVAACSKNNTSSWSDTSMFYISSTSSFFSNILEKQNDVTIGCYPNPNKGNFKIYLDLKVNCHLTIGVYNIDGEFITNISHRFFENGKYLMQKLVNIPSGHYYLIFRSDNWFKCMYLQIIL